MMDTSLYVFLEPYSHLSISSTVWNLMRDNLPEELILFLYYGKDLF